MGELIDGTEVWHFQDDAVEGSIVVFPDGLDCNEQTISQGEWFPTTYQSPEDGPTEIERYSKDLAFELYTVPEPATMGLLGIGAVSMLIRRRRR